MNRSKVLIINSSVNSKLCLTFKLAQPAAEVTLLTEGTWDLTLIDEQVFDCVCLDVTTVAHGDLIEECVWVRAISCKLPLWVVGGDINIAKSKELIKAGASDYVALDKLTPDYIDLMLRYSQRILHEQKLAKQAEQALRQVALFTTALESAANAMVITDQGGKVWWANSAFCELSGYTWFELLGQNLRLLKSGVQNQEFYQELWQKILAGQVWKGELVNRSKDGSLYTEEMTITPVRDEQGEISNFIGIKEDTTQRNRDIRERQESAQRLQEANKMLARAERLTSLGTMAAGIAHEINQPLNSLKVMADGMLYWYKKGKPAAYDKVMNNIRNISSQADRIDSIIKHMRAFVRSGQPTKLTPCNLKAVVEGALEMVGSQLVAHGVFVKNDLTDTWVMGEDTRLEEVVINLLVNAMQSLDQTNQKNKQIMCKTWVEERVFLEISDNGLGIAEEIKNSIFEPFFTTKPVGEGTGLGLSIVHTILSIYDGRIQALSNDFGGATFQMDFPITEINSKER